MPVIDRDSQDKVLTYLVESKLINEYGFEVTDYQLNVGGDHIKVNLDKLVSDIDHAYQARTPFAQIAHQLTASTSVGLPNGVGNISVNGPLDAIFEMLGVVHSVVRLPTERVEIGIKGYADGEVTGDWKPVVAHLPPQLVDFPVLQPSDSRNQNWFFYKKGEVQRRIKDPYRNDDLPDLRAQYIRNEFVEPFVNRSANRDRCKIFVLHNKPVGIPMSPELRKAQVYLMVYLKGGSQ